MSADMSARSVGRTIGGDRVRALQRVLYRCAKQDRDRRFHALFDKVARGDVMERAWGEVRANRGAAGVDGVTIEAVEDSGVGDFLDGARRQATDGELPSAAPAAGPHSQAESAGQDEAARDSHGGRPGGDGGGEGGA